MTKSIVLKAPEKVIITKQQITKAQVPIHSDLDSFVIPRDVITKANTAGFLKKSSASLAVSEDFDQR